jgi:hypothetical protein
VTLIGAARAYVLIGGWHSPSEGRRRGFPWSSPAWPYLKQLFEQRGGSRTRPRITLPLVPPSQPGRDPGGLSPV